MCTVKDEVRASERAGGQRVNADESRRSQSFEQVNNARGRIKAQTVGEPPTPRNPP